MDVAVLVDDLGEPSLAVVAKAGGLAERVGPRGHAHEAAPGKSGRTPPRSLNLGAPSFAVVGVADDAAGRVEDCRHVSAIGPHEARLVTLGIHLERAAPEEIISPAAARTGGLRPFDQVALGV